MLISPSQCKAARGLVNLSQGDLAQLSNLGLSTIVDFERGRRRVSEEAVLAIRLALDGAGVAFLDKGETSPGAGVALHSPIPVTEI